METGMLTVQAVAARLGVSTGSVYTLIRNGDLRAVNLAASIHGGKTLYRVSPEWLEAFLSGRTVQQVPVVPARRFHHQAPFTPRRLRL